MRKGEREGQEKGKMECLPIIILLMCIPISKIRVHTLLCSAGSSCVCTRERVRECV